MPLIYSRGYFGSIMRIFRPPSCRTSLVEPPPPMATMLHTIATGNMTPSYRVLPDGTVRQIYFYCVDVSEFVVNKLADRGSLSARGIVTNVQDFVVNLQKGLGL